MSKDFKRIWWEIIETIILAILVFLVSIILWHMFWPHAKVIQVDKNTWDIKTIADNLHIKLK